MKLMWWYEYEFGSINTNIKKYKWVKYTYTIYFKYTYTIYFNYTYFYKYLSILIFKECSETPNGHSSN